MKRDHLNAGGGASDEHVKVLDMIPLLAIKPCLNQAIDLMQVTFSKASQARKLSNAAPAVAQESWSFEHSVSATMFEDQSRIVWLTAVSRQLPAVWLTQNHSAINTVLNLLCHYASVSPEAMAAGMMWEHDFEGLMWSVGKIAGSPLRFCDINSSEDFREVVAGLARQGEFTYVLCDWYLSREEVEFAEQMAKQSPLFFLSPS